MTQAKHCATCCCGADSVDTSKLPYSAQTLPVRIGIAVLSAVLAAAVLLVVVWVFGMLWAVATGAWS